LCIAVRYDAAMRHFPLRELGYALGFIVLLAALYVGAYYALSEREDRTYLMVMRHIERMERTAPKVSMVNYRYGGELAVAFFAPIHEVDRKFRPDWWDEEAYLTDPVLPFP
jgi:hypothetical protein